ncbi:MAG TPA: rod shape-determining protein MreD [Clostridiaceae bacterium]
MKKIFVLFLLSILFTILDNTLVHFIAIQGYFPSLLFAFIILYSINNEGWIVIFLGIFSGFLQDVFFVHGFGINMLINMLCCYFTIIIGRSIFKGKIIIPVLTCFSLSIVKGIIILSMLFIYKEYISFSNIFFSSLYTFAISIIMFKLVYKLSNLDFMQNKWRF